MEEIYLVGQEWYSADQGDFPNTSEFPVLVTTDKKEAFLKFQELKRENASWGCGKQVAYWCTKNLERKYNWD